MSYTNPCEGRVSSGFGYRVHPISHKKTFHNGLDIAVPIGTVIKAPDAGKITEYWNHDKGGKCLALTTWNGVRFGFAHLSARLVEKGMAVSAGQAIAHSGNTGASTGPHLHFTMSKQGKWINPADHFKF
jgi:murein DD-endopeptidase MepM/ murein hydrolase activator NlpD